MRRLTIQRGHPERDALALANDGLAHKIARRFHRCVRGLELSDLLQEARIGLLLAAETFDETRGYAFSTYAYDWMTQRIQRAMLYSSCRPYLPWWVDKAARRVLEESARTGETDHAATARRLGYTRLRVARIVEAITAQGDVLSMDHDMLTDREPAGDLPADCVDRLFAVLPPEDVAEARRLWGVPLVPGERIRCEPGSGPAAQRRRFAARVREAMAG